MIIATENMSLEQLYLRAKANKYNENKKFFTRSEMVITIGMTEEETKYYLDNLTKMLSEKEGRMDAYTTMSRFKKTDIINEIKRWTKSQKQNN